MFAVNPANGEEVWKVVMQGQFWSSPVLVNDRIYAINSNGVVYVVSTDGKLLAKSELNEEITATPAIVDGRIYIRSAKNLLCIGRR